MDVSPWIWITINFESRSDGTNGHHQDKPGRFGDGLLNRTATLMVPRIVGRERMNRILMEIYSISLLGSMEG